jgi:hypothetical protein
MWEFIVQKGVSIAWGILAMAAQLAGYTNVAIALALVAVAAFFFVAPIWHHAHAWHRNRLDRGLRSVDASHLMMVGLGGVIVFSAIALGALIWRNNPASVRLSENPAEVKPAPIIIQPPLTEEGRRFREELRRFILSDVSNVIETFGSFSAGSANDFINKVRNNRETPADERERFDAVYNLFEAAKQPYEQKVKPLLDAANKTVENLDLTEIERTLKIYSESYRADLNTFIWFVISSGVQPNQDALEQWKAADERAGVSFRNLKTFPETAALMERWRGTGVYSGGLSDGFRQRMRAWEALKNAKQ